jgi:hypothetical protein
MSSRNHTGRFSPNRRPIKFLRLDDRAVARELDFSTPDNNNAVDFPHPSPAGVPALPAPGDNMNDGPGDDPPEEPNALRVSAARHGRQTQVSKFPYAPKSFPETQTVTHWLRGETMETTACSAAGIFPEDFLSKEIRIRLNSPVAITSTASEGIYAAASDYTMFTYMQALYDHFTVIACHVHVTIIDFGICNHIGISAAGVNEAQIAQSANGSNPPLIAFYKDCSELANLDLDGKTMNYLNNIKGLRRENFVPFYGPGYNNHLPHGHWSMTRSYTHADYMKLVDIASDAKDDIWADSGSTHPLDYKLKIAYIPAYQGFGTDATSDRLVKVEYDIEYITQYKELKDVYLWGYRGGAPVP